MPNVLLRTPGDYIISQCTISNDNEEIDFVDIVDSIIVTDDLYSNGSVVKLNITDTGEFYNKFNIRGGETINLSFYTDFNGLEPNKELTYSKTFIVKSIENLKTDDRSDNIRLTISAVSKIFVSNSTKIIRRSYSDKISKMIERIYYDVLKHKDELNVINTDNIYKFTVPNWRPLQAINILTRRAKTTIVKSGATYSFYEDKNGFHFKPLEFFVTQPRAKTYRKRLKGVDSINRDFFAYNSFDVIKNTDIIKTALSGGYGGRLDSYNVLTKEYKKYNFELSEKYLESDHLNSSKGYIADNQKQLKNRLILNNSQNLIFNNSTLARESKINLMNSFILELDTPGYSGHSIGDKIYLEINSYIDFVNDNKEQAIDYLNGYYIIQKITHIITKDYYRNILRLVKDSYHGTK